MKSVMCHAFGEPNSLSVEEIEPIVPGHGQVRIAVKMASVNFFDILMIQGKYQRKPPFPFTAGTDAAGDVLEIGPGITAVKPGDRVMAFNLSGGAFAEEMVVAEGNVFLLPSSIDYAAAAALKSVYGTALYTLRDRARLRRDETLLVLGAAGGLGLALVEVGAILGARVIAAVGSDEKAERLRARGVRDIIVVSKSNLRESVNEFTDGKGVDVVADPVGGDLFDQAIKTAAWGARVCVLGFTSGRIPQLPVNYALLKSFDLIGVNYGGWVDRDPQAHRRETRDLIDMCATGTIKPAIYKVFSLDEAAKAMATLQNRSVVGKVLLSTRPIP
jgi:NADPH:quinone reductase